MTFGNTKLPSTLVCASVVVPRAALTKVTVAPGTTAPCASLTEPETVPVVICAETGTAVAQTAIHTATEILKASPDHNDLLSSATPTARERDQCSPVLRPWWVSCRAALHFFESLASLSLPHDPRPCIIRPRSGPHRSSGRKTCRKNRVRSGSVPGARTSPRRWWFLPRCVCCVESASAQLFQWTPEQLIKYTSKNPYDRSPDGRPKVPDEMLERLKGLVAEEVQAVLPGRGFPNQFEPRDGWKVLQPDQKMVGRVFTIQFMPLRGDIAEVDEADAKAKGTTPARNQTAIDMLQPGDVIVADVFGADWNFVGNKLAHYIQTTTKNGMIVDGGVYWLERIAATGMQAYYKNSFPTQGMRVMVTGINIPVRIGKALVMPGDVVLADREGLWFIPPHMVKDVVESGEMSKARDDWSLMMLGTGKYTSRQIYGPLTPELEKQRDDYIFQKTGRRAPRDR